MRVRRTHSTIWKTLGLAAAIATLPAGARDALSAVIPPGFAAADSAVAPPPAPAPAETPKAGASVPPAAAAAPAVAAPMTRKEKRAAEKKAKHDAKAAKKAARPAKPDDSLEQWRVGRTWVSVRGGYARSGEESAANGNVGFGVGARRFMMRQVAVGIYGHGDLLGKFGAAAEIEYPFTAELTYHFRWKTALRPYLGGGGGGFHHKYFRTGADATHWHSGFYFVGGIDAPISKHSVLGLDGRAESISGDPDFVDPVFGREDSRLEHYSVKLSYSLVF